MVNYVKKNEEDTGTRPAHSPKVVPYVTTPPSVGTSNPGSWNSEKKNTLINKILFALSLN